MRALMTGPRATTPPPDPPAPSGGCLRLRAGGQFATGGAVIELEPKDALLLAYLAVEGPTPRGRLAALLWPDVDEERARGNLRQRLMRLKRTTGAELVVGNPQATLAAGIAHDLDDGHDLLQAIEARQAAGLADWLEAQRERRRRARFDWHDAAATQAETEGDLAAALEHVSALVALDPLSEHAHRRVMKLHYLRGDSAAAIAAYERCRQMLRRELNAAPSKETEALRAAVGGTVVALPAAPARRTVPLSVLRPPRLIGRAAEWAALQAARDERRPALVLGEAGLGKTRLVTDFARAQGAAAVVSARPGDAQVVYALTARLLRQLPPEVLAALDAPVRKELARLLPEFGDAMPIGSDAERARFFNAVGAALAAAAQRLDIVVVDDLHFADEASVELVQYLAADCPLHWLFASRPAELGAAARALMQAMRGKAAGTLVELGPLTPAQLLELIDSLGLDGVDAAALAPALTRQTGGNPMFALESIKAWLAQRGESDGSRLPVAAHLGAIVERRIGRLSPEAVKLARCAAVAGQDFSAELAAHVLGVRPLDLADAWAELEHAQVFRDGAFAHDLIHEAALASVPPPIARQLHRELALYLSEHATTPEREADHWLAAGDELRALPVLLQAAESSRLALRPRESTGWLMQAAEIAERCARPDMAFAALFRVVEAALVADRGALDDRILDRLQASARTEREEVQALVARAETLSHRGRLADASALAGKAAAQARAAGLEDLAVGALRIAACSATMQGDSEQAVRLLRPILPWVLEHGAAEQQVEFFGDLAVCLDNVDQQGEAQEFHRRAVDAALRARRFDLAVTAQTNLAVSYLDIGWPQRAVDSLREAVRVGLAYDSVAGSGDMVGLIECAALRDLRRYAEAIRSGEAALDDIRHNPIGVAAVSNNLACTWIHLGQFARAERAIKDIAISDEHPAWVRARALQMQGRSRWAQGHRADAGRAWQLALQAASGSGRTILGAMIALDHALTLASDEALARVMAVLNRAERLGHRGTALAARVRAMSFAVLAGDVGAAVRLAEMGDDADADVEPNDMYRGEYWLAVAGAFRAAGRLQEARRTVGEGLEQIRAVASRNVPADFRDSFLNRNPVNRELLTLATRLK